MLARKLSRPTRFERYRSALRAAAIAAGAVLVAFHGWLFAGQIADGINVFLASGTLLVVCCGARFGVGLGLRPRGGLRCRSEILVPAGNGRSAFVDVVDVAAVAAKTLLEPGHSQRGYTLTGPEALSFHQIAQILSDVLGRPIRYRPPRVLRFIRDQHSEGVPLGMALVMTALYTVQRLGRADGLTDDVLRLLGRPPSDFRSYAERTKAVWAEI